VGQSTNAPEGLGLHHAGADGLMLAGRGEMTWDWARAAFVAEPGDPAPARIAWSMAARSRWQL